MKKFLLFLILLIPIFNINALTLCDDTIVPDLPQDINNSYIITYSSSVSSHRLYSFDSSSTIVVINGNNLQISGSSIKRYNESGGNWVYTANGNQSIDLSLQTIIATTIEIKNSNNEVIYSSGYNINCEVPPEPIPQDFSLINTIASYINTFVTGLQNNNISIEVTFISLIMFNFLVFVICYIITHLE